MFDLAHNTLDLPHILFGFGEFEFSFAGAGFMLRNARRLFEEIAPVLGLRREHLIDAPLLHHRVGRFTDRYPRRARALP